MYYTTTDKVSCLNQYSLFHLNDGHPGFRIEKCRGRIAGLVVITWIRQLSTTQSNGYRDDISTHKNTLGFIIVVNGVGKFPRHGCPAIQWSIINNGTGWILNKRICWEILFHWATNLHETEGIQWLDTDWVGVWFYRQLLQQRKLPWWWTIHGIVVS